MSISNAIRIVETSLSCLRCRNSVTRVLVRVSWQGMRVTEQVNVVTKLGLGGDRRLNGGKNKRYLASATERRYILNVQMALTINSH